MCHKTVFEPKGLQKKALKDGRSKIDPCDVKAVFLCEHYSQQPTYLCGSGSHLRRFEWLLVQHLSRKGVDKAKLLLKEEYIIV